MKLTEAQETIRRIAEVADAISWQSGVGGMELAGQIVSVLARHPELVERFLSGGSELMLEGLLGAERGCLTFYNMKGEVTTPHELAASRQVQKLKRAVLSGDQP